MTGVRLEKLVKRYGDVQVVHGIDLEVAEKEFVVLVGPSGCGKSTTLRMIAGLEEISDGTLSIGERKVNDVAPKDRDVAMVFQNYALYPHLDVAENIAFGLRIRRVPKEKITRSVTEVAAILGLTDYLKRKPADLSGGQRQRVAMGRAIVRHPAVFLFDEPLSNLDAQLRTQMRAEIKRLHTRLGVTSVYVTHDQVEAMTLADRIVVMQSGAIQQIGSPDDIYNDPANTFVASFIGSPPMNLIDGTLADGTFTAPGVRVENLSGEHGGKVTLGVRPEDCAVVGDAAHLSGEVYGVEPTGDLTYLTLRTGDGSAGAPGGKMIEVKADRSYRAELKAPESVRFDTSRVYLFDTGTGRRLR